MFVLCREAYDNIQTLLTQPKKSVVLFISLSPYIKMTKINLLINNSQVKLIKVIILNQQLFYYLYYKNKGIVKFIYIFIENIRRILIDPGVQLFI